MQAEIQHEDSLDIALAEPDKPVRVEAKVEPARSPSPIIIWRSSSEEVKIATDVPASLMNRCRAPPSTTFAAPKSARTKTGTLPGDGDAAAPAVRDSLSNEPAEFDDRAEVRLRPKRSPRPGQGTTRVRDDTWRGNRDVVKDAVTNGLFITKLYKSYLNDKHGHVEPPTYLS